MCTGLVRREAQWSELKSTETAIYLHIYAVCVCMWLCIYYRAMFSHFIYDQNFLWFELPRRLNCAGFWGWWCYDDSFLCIERNRVDGVSPRTINIFAINFLILSVWSANSVFYDILRLSISTRHPLLLPAAPIFGEHFAGHTVCRRVCVSVLLYKWAKMSRCCTNFGNVLTLFIYFAFRFLCVFLHIFFSFSLPKLFVSFLVCSVCVFVKLPEFFFLGGGRNEQ